jgi:hypothetical protein
MQATILTLPWTEARTDSILAETQIECKPVTLLLQPVCSMKWHETCQEVWLINLNHKSCKWIQHALCRIPSTYREFYQHNVSVFDLWSSIVLPVAFRSLDARFAHGIMEVLGILCETILNMFSLCPWGISLSATSHGLNKTSSLNYINSHIHQQNLNTIIHKE